MNGPTIRPDAGHRLSLVRGPYFRPKILWSVPWYGFWTSQWKTFQHHIQPNLTKIQSFLVHYFTSMASNSPKIFQRLDSLFQCLYCIRSWIINQLIESFNLTNDVTLVSNLILKAIIWLLQFALTNQKTVWVTSNPQKGRILIRLWLVNINLFSSQ